jgi:D-3-phosphoglycerate dehydrogenase
VTKVFQVGLTRDFLSPDGSLPFEDIGLHELATNPAIRHRFMDDHPQCLGPGDISGSDAIVSLAPEYTPLTFTGADGLLVISRFGVGYDMVDVAACTGADVALCIAKGAVDNSMAEAILAWMFALSLRLFDKDRLQSAGRWDVKLDYTARELRHRQLGIGGKLLQKVSALEMQPVMTFDPFLERPGFQQKLRETLVA